MNKNYGGAKIMNAIEKLNNKINNITEKQKEIINNAIENSEYENYIKFNIDGKLTQDTKMWIKKYKLDFEENLTLDGRNTVIITW